MDLDTILSGAPTQETPPPARSPALSPDSGLRANRERGEPEPAAAEPPRPASPDYPPGENPPTREVVPPAPPAGDQEPDHVPIAALRDERKKRQEMERTLQEYVQRLQRYEQPAQQPPPPPPPPPRPDLFADPDGAINHIAEQLRAENRQEQLRQKVDLSVLYVRDKYPDYQDAETAFLEQCRADPALYDRMLHHPYPAEFAYQVGKRIATLAQIGPDPDAYRQKIEAEALEKARAQLQQEAPQTPTPARASLPPSLAQGRDTSGRFQPAWGGPPSFKDILAPPRR
jgi:hypothetical protein